MKFAIFATPLLCVSLGCLGQNSAPAKCPISISHLMLPYNHVEGKSLPQVQLSFTNDTHQRIIKARFKLSVLDAQGSEQPYDQALTFTAGVDPGKTASSQWDLPATSVDIHRTGEIVYLTSVRFQDGTSWKDDGNLRCEYKVDYSPR